MTRKELEWIAALVATVLLVAAALLSSGCAFGEREWRQSSYDVTVDAPGTDSDHRCSDPAPWSGFRACLLHDLAYSAARSTRCAGAEDPAFTSEQARFAADAMLLQQMALDGYGEVWATGYYLAVRWGGWWPFHFSGCPPPLQR